MKYEFIAVNDRKFVTKRVIPSDMVTDTLSDIIKQLWGCDTVLKKQGNHYFCDELLDAEWEDIN
jgi:hypothetical protein